MQHAITMPAIVQQRVRWTLGSGQWTLESGHWTLDTGLWTLDSGHWNMDTNVYFSLQPGLVVYITSGAGGCSNNLCAWRGVFVFTVVYITRYYINTDTCVQAYMHTCIHT